jgi:hypothetical protein
VLVCLHKFVPIKQQVFADHKYLKNTNYQFILIYSSILLLVLLHDLLTDAVLRSHYKLCSYENNQQDATV